MSDVKYNICTFGKKLPIGLDTPVTIRVGGQTYERRTDPGVEGRINSMKQIYEENGIREGDVLKATYSEKSKTIDIVVSR